MLTKKSVLGLVLMFVLMMPPMSYGTDYVNRLFPSDRIIMKNLGDAKAVYGKAQITTNEYRVYYSNQAGKVSAVTVIQLDSGRWVIQNDRNEMRIIKR